MALNSDIRLRKGSFDVTLFTAQRTENLKNQLQFLPPIQAASNQSLGPKDTKAVDLLRITESFSFSCYIVKQESPAKTAKEIKEELISIFKGANINGGTPVTLTYEDSDISTYITDLVILHLNNDDAQASYAGYDSAEYRVTISLTKGVAVS